MSKLHKVIESKKYFLLIVFLRLFSTPSILSRMYSMTKECVVLWFHSNLFKVHLSNFTAT